MPAGYLPGLLRKFVGWFHRWLPWLFGPVGLEIGPLPEGMAVGLLANLDIERLKSDLRVIPLLLEAKRDLKKLPRGPDNKVDNAEAHKVFAPLVDQLLPFSTCPDFVVNRGHYFGTDAFKEEPGLSDEDKRALIEFLKTF